MVPSNLRRRLHLETLEPRWTMDAQICTELPLAAASATAAVCPSAADNPSSLSNGVDRSNDVDQVQKALNQFAFDVYQTITDSNANDAAANHEALKNEAISPFSIATALAMVYAGARGETASQLALALHVELPPDRFHAAMQSILQNILPDANSKAQLETANGLWGQIEFDFLDSFRQLTHDRYGANIQEADFAHAPDEATAAINDWVRKQTHDMIKSLFDSLPTDTRLVLANALYFKAAWATEFDPSATQRTVFHLASGDTMDVSMMHRGGSYGYTQTSDYQIAELPYADDRYSMLIVLPKQASAGLSASFSATDLNNWLSALHSTDLSLALPKFMLETSMSIIDTLKSLGITDAFDDSAANFSGIDGRRDLKISKAVHKAVVEVDETGTKAAAVTGIAVGLIHACACSPPPPIPFTADHPFHFLILDHQTDSILFVGQVQQPTAYDGNDQPAVELPKTQFTPVQPPGGIPIQPPGIMPIESPRVSPIGPPRITFFPPPQLISPVTSNPANPFDVNGDGEESPADALIVINYINDHSQQSSLSQLTTQLIGSHLYADVDGDGIVTPRDALRIINRLNEKPASAAPTAIIPDSASGEGESAASDTNPFTSAVDALLSLDDLLRIDDLLRPDQLATPRRALQTS